MTIARDAEKANGFAALNMLPSELAEAGKKQIEAIAHAQTEVLDALQEWNRDYLDCARSEAILASDIANQADDGSNDPRDRHRLPGVAGSLDRHGWRG